MSCTEIGTDVKALGQRQDTARREDLAVTNDHSAVMQRSFVVEDVAEQRGRGLAVEGRARARDLIEQAVSFKDDQRARAGFREDRAAVGYVGDRFHHKGLGALTIAVHKVSQRHVASAEALESLP